LDAGIKEKIEAIAKSYGASGVEYSEQVILWLVMSVTLIHEQYNYSYSLLMEHK
jgi:hypothetical protein